MVFLFIKAEAMVVRFGTLAPLKTPIKVLTVVVQSASTLLSMDVISGSVQRARRELLYPIILSSSGMEELSIKLFRHGNTGCMGIFYGSYGQ